MKKYIALIIALGLLAIPNLAFADQNGVTAAGNYTTDTSKYYTVWINTTILNGTTGGFPNCTSAQEIYVRAAVNISVNDTLDVANSTLENLNFTLSDEFIVDTVSKIRLLNASLGYIMSANATYADGAYTKVNFNAPNITGAGGGNLQEVSCQAVRAWWITNQTANCNMTFYVEFRLRPVDTNRTISRSNVGTQYVDNVTYKGYSNLEPYVIFIYKSSNQNSWDRLLGVEFGGVKPGAAVKSYGGLSSPSEYTFDLTNGFTYPSGVAGARVEEGFQAVLTGTSKYESLVIGYIMPESPHVPASTETTGTTGTTGGRGTFGTLTPEQVTTQVNITLAIIVVICIGVSVVVIAIGISKGWFKR